LRNHLLTFGKHCSKSHRDPSQRVTKALWDHSVTVTQMNATYLPQRDRRLSWLGGWPIQQTCCLLWNDFSSLQYVTTANKWI